jgi:Zn-dependent protease with chaperone function
MNLHQLAWSPVKTLPPRVWSIALVRYVAAAILGCGVAAHPAGSQAVAPGSTVAEIAAALNAPLSPEETAKAREVDDHLLSTGEFLSVKGYLVTDARMTQSVTDVVDRLLRTMNQDSSKWVIRVIDTKPHVANAFVTGGKYIYVFTGLIEQAASKDELAFVLSHELGHSLLHHVLRTENSPITAVTELAELIGVLAGGEEGLAKVQAVTETIRAAYSRADEEEADTFAAILAWKAGYDPLRGADFFTRQIRQEAEHTEQELEALAALREEALAAIEACEEVVFDGSGACAKAESRRRAYNAEVEDYNQRLADEPPPMYWTHPGDQSRVAAIAAVTDYLRGKRDEASLAKYQQTYRVVAAIKQTRHMLLQPGSSGRSGAPPVAPAAGPQRPPSARSLPEPRAPNSAGQDSQVAERLRQLENLRKQGLVTEQEYQEKRRQILDQF